MVRVTNAVASRKRRKKIRKLVKGYVGDRKGHLRQSKDAVLRSLAYQTAHRKKRKRDFRALWVTRIGIAAKQAGISYSRMMGGLAKMDCHLNRKILSEIAIHDPDAFVRLAEHAKKAEQSSS